MKDDLDKETRLQEALPCPFCGSTNIWTYPGSTFRWRYAGCAECGAQCGECRMDTIGVPRPEAIDDVNRALAAEWNKRALRPEAGTRCPKCTAPHCFCEPQSGSAK